MERKDVDAGRTPQDDVPAYPANGTSDADSGSLPDPVEEAQAYQHILVGGTPTLTAKDMAEATDTPVSRVEQFWVAMGFKEIDPEAVVFTDADLEAYRGWSRAIDSGVIDLATGISLMRGQSHIADRLALWQVEALVEDNVRRHDMDDRTARLTAMEELRDLLPLLESELAYAWRRQLEALMHRVAAEVATKRPDGASRRFPLSRALGFVDMVSYTASSTILGERLVSLIERFEEECRDTVAMAGGRVVKMIGDAVLFIADDLTTGLRVVTSLIERLTEDPEILPVRAAFVRGDVFSRSGDVFGPPVNLASRLVDIAPVGQIMTDASTAAAIAAGKGGSGYTLDEFPSVELRGFGTVSPYLLSRDV